MGKKEQRALEAQLRLLNQQYQQAMNAVNTTDPYTQAIGNDALNTLSWAKGGDYRQAPKGTFFNMVDPSVVARQRQISQNAGGQGVAGLGGAGNATALALNKQNMDDEFSRDAASNYQSEVSNAVRNAAGVAGQLGNAEMQKKLSILGQAGNLYSQGLNIQQQQANKPGFWSKLGGFLIGGAAQAGRMFAGGI